MVRSRIVLAASTMAIAALVANCRAPTQILVEVTTDVPCSDLGGITITVGELGGTSGIEDRAPTAQTNRCDPQTGRIGSLMIVPSGERDALVAIKVVAGRKRAAEECRAPAYGPDCIVARRAIRFLPSTELELPILLRASCLGKPCEPTDTCVDSVCVPAEIKDPAACEQGCDESVLVEGSAPPPPPPPPPIDATTPDVTPMVDAGLFCDPNNPDLIGCYRFEGSARDESRYDQQPNMAANVQFPAGKVGQALRLTTAPVSLVQIPYGPNGATWNSTQITVEAWLRPVSLPLADAGNGRAGVIENDNRFAIFLYPDGRMLCRTTNPIIGYGAVLPLGQWTHFACVWDNGVLTYYVNGVPSGPIAAIDTPKQSTLTTQFMAFGSDAPSGGDNFDGSIDEVRIWRSARTASEIQDAARR